MKLKKLQVTGFKSFLDKTSINFPPGISAIVGPNGCGKSNIVDALRWVMGEQSVKQLRGKSKEDVIFAGADGKPPLNVAEVSLTLANHNGSAPEELKDFTEIMLTRRLYRSGESAYFINKQPCRLKDIHNVFMGSGMGAKSYAVIQQGNIGAITDAGPEERRFFIEEAAAVTRYKTRKKEALRKVEATNQNLLRISDIIAEIKRQMAGLKRQAKKAEVYKNYQDRIKELDILLALNYYDDYTQKILEKDAVLKGLKDSDIEHTSKLKRLDAAVEKIKLQRLQKNQEISKQKSDKFETQRNIDRIENDLAHLHNDVERLTNEVTGLESAREDLEEKNRNIISEIAQIENQNISLKADIINVKSSIDEERLASQNLRNKLSTLNQELETYKKNLMDLVALEARYKNLRQNTLNNKEGLKRRLKRIDEEEVIAHKKVTEASNNETQSRKQLESFKQNLEDLSKRIDIMREQLGEKNKALSKQVKFVQTLEIERNKARSKYTTLRKMEDNFEWYKDGVRAIMKKGKNNADHGESESGFQNIKDNGILGLMADILEPEPSVETAVEAVLGESLQYILVKDQETGLGAIDYLQTHGAGRSGFIPVSSVKDLECDCGKKPNPAKLLLNHVSAKPGFEKITKMMLGHVIVTSCMEEAIKVWNTSGAMQTVVTKDGDIISHQGLMVGGSKDNLSGILAKKKEIKKLEHQVTSLDQQLESARHDQKAMESDVRIIESDMQELIEQKNKTTQDEIEAEKALYKATEDLKHARNHLEIVQLEQEQLLGEESDIDDEMAKYNRLSAEIEGEVKAAQKKVTETSEKIGSISSKMEDFNQRIVDLKLNMTAFTSRLENSSNTLRRLKEFRDDGIKRLEQLSGEITRKNQKSIDSKQKIIDYDKKLSNMYDALKDLEKVLESNEADYHAINVKLNENDSIVSDIQSKREETLQKIRLLEVEQSQQHIKREAVANRVEERYHRPLSEFRAEFGHISKGIKMSPKMTIGEMEEELPRLRKKIANIGDVNMGAIKEYEQLKERFDFLSEQREDLVKAVDDLQKVIKKINRITQERFMKTFNAVNEKLKEVFPRLFEGGSARLELTQPDKPLETGVEFMIHPPGKKLTRMSLLSGGEKALSAIAFIFSIFLIKPASFCLMDEIDAPLDDANVSRFNELLKIIGEKSQIIMITHNKRSMVFADTLFGITMEKKGISKIVSVNFEKSEE